MLINEPKIIIVDDGEKDIWDSFEEFLELKEFSGRVKIAYNVDDAVSVMKDLIPDIVITEIWPYGTGLEVVQEAKKLNRQTKVIYITSYTDILENLDEIKTLCPWAWLKKPFTCQQLYYYILGAIGKYKEASEIMKECHDYERS